MGNSQNNPPDPTPVPAKTPKVKRVSRREIIDEVMDFRRQDASHAQIAFETKLTIHEVAQIIETELGQLIVEPEKLAAALELEQIRDFIKGSYEAAAGGDTPAASAIMAWSKRKRELEAILRPPSIETATDTFVQTGSLLDFIEPKHRPPERPIVGHYKNGKPKYGPAPKVDPKKGRPKHEVTELSCRTVMHMASAMVRQDRIAAALCISVPTLIEYYGTLMEAAPGIAIANLHALMMSKAGKSESAAKWLLERMSPDHRIERSWGARPDLHKEGGTGAGAVEQEKAIVIRGGLPQQPAEWADPPGQAEAIAAAGTKTDDFGEAVKRDAPQTGGVLKIAGT